MNYELHPLCTLFPRMADAEFNALVQDIATNGLRQPIVLHEKMILDGGNRYLACIAAEVEPDFIEHDGGNLVSFVLSANMHRRHMTPGQQAAIVASAQDWAKAQAHGGDRKSKVQDCTLNTAEDRAAQSGASLRTQKTADKVAKASPELAKQVAHGEISLPKAIEKIDGKRQTAKPEPEAASEEDDYTETDELRDQVAGLQDMLAVRGAPEEERETTEKLVAGMREQIKTLTASLDAVTVSRDALLRTNAQLMKQVAMQRKEIDKLRSMGAVA